MRKHHRKDSTSSGNQGVINEEEEDQHHHHHHQQQQPQQQQPQQQPQLQPQQQQQQQSKRSSLTTFNGWMKGIFKKKPKEITPTPRPRPQSTQHTGNEKLLYMRNSLTSLFKKKNHIPKLTIKDIELLDGMEVNDLKKRYMVTGPKANILEMLVADYKSGRFSAPGGTHKPKPTSSTPKVLDKVILDQMIKDYDEEIRKKDLEEIQKNADELKKRFAMPEAQVLKLDNIVKELYKGKSSQMDISAALLDPKKLTKEQLNTLIKEYEDSQVKKKRLSNIFGQSRLSLDTSKKRFFHLRGKGSGK